MTDWNERHRQSAQHLQLQRALEASIDELKRSNDALEKRVEALERRQRPEGYQQHPPSPYDAGGKRGSRER